MESVNGPDMRGETPQKIAPASAKGANHTTRFVARQNTTTTLQKAIR
jgi:hypothetical protein